MNTNPEPTPADVEKALLDDIGVMMSEFVDNWPKPKRIETALALIAKTIRIALNPPKHQFWGAGEAGCPSDIKAGNGELWNTRTLSSLPSEREQIVAWLRDLVAAGACVPPSWAANQIEAGAHLPTTEQEEG